MANTNLANVPNFYKGTYANIVKAVSPGGVFADNKKAAIAFVTDRNCLAIVDIGGQITLVGDESKTVSGKTGSVADPIILDELPAGVYSVSGSYRTSATEPVVSTSANQLFIVSSTGGVTKMDGDGMTRTVYDEITGVTTEETYVTDAEIIKTLAEQSDIDELFDE